MTPSRHSALSRPFKHMMPTLCRGFLKTALVTLFCHTGFATAVPTPTAPLKPGDVVGLSSSAFRVDHRNIAFDAVGRLQRLGFQVATGDLLGRVQYFAGSIATRVNNLNQMFANPKIHAIFEIRGGWGSAQILPYLNYNLIARNPKPLIGFSDITSLLLALYTQAHVASYYGPMPGAYQWTPYTINNLKKVLFSTGSLMTLRNQPNYPITTITPGIAQGILLGGNLSVLVSLIGTPYFPQNWTGKILYVEDTHEDVYEIDRMLTQLQLAGVFSHISGFIFGQCTDCTQLVPGSPTLQEVIREHIQPYQIPAFMGLEFGHQDNILTLPEGLPGSMNANNGTVTFKN